LLTSHARSRSFIERAELTVAFWVVPASAEYLKALPRP
jgi:hypothetical protein